MDTNIPHTLKDQILTKIKNQKENESLQKDSSSGGQKKYIRTVSVNEVKGLSRYESVKKSKELSKKIINMIFDKKITKMEIVERLFGKESSEDPYYIKYVHNRLYDIRDRTEEIIKLRNMYWGCYHYSGTIEELLDKYENGTRKKVKKRYQKKYPPIIPAPIIDSSNDTGISIKLSNIPSNAKIVEAKLPFTTSMLTIENGVITLVLTGIIKDTKVTFK